MRLGRALARAPRRRPRLVPYLLVDRSRARSVRATIEALRDGGASALELGFPFSDPIADGPTLEAASDRALRAGTTWKDLELTLRVAGPMLPTAVMTYANPVWSRGLATACRQLRAAGGSGLIVPDLSFEESGPWRTAARRAGLDLVLMAAPGTSPERVRLLARHSRGFLYLVGRYGTTGRGPTAAHPELRGIVGTSHREAPALPVLVGFGVRDRASWNSALATGADGAIVGTALEERLAAGNGPAQIRQWVERLVGSSTRRPSPTAQQPGRRTAR